MKLGSWVMLPRGLSWHECSPLTVDRPWQLRRGMWRVETVSEKEAWQVLVDRAGLLVFPLLFFDV